MRKAKEQWHSYFEFHCSIFVFITDPISEEPVSQDPIGIWLSDFYEILNFSKNRIVYADKRIKMNCDFC